MGSTECDAAAAADATTPTRTVAPPESASAAMIATLPRARRPVAGRTGIDV